MYTLYTYTFQMVWDYIEPYENEDSDMNPPPIKVIVLSLVAVVAVGKFTPFWLLFPATVVAYIFMVATLKKGGEQVLVWLYFFSIGIVFFICAWVLWVLFHLAQVGQSFVWLGNQLS